MSAPKSSADFGHPPDNNHGFLWSEPEKDRVLATAFKVPAYLHIESDSRAKSSPAEKNELNDARILILDGQIKDATFLLPLLEELPKGPLVIVAEDAHTVLAAARADATGDDGEDDEVDDVAAMVVTALRRARAVAVRSPAFGPRRTELLDDLAVLTGGKRMSLSGVALEQIVLGDLGTAGRVVISDDRAKFSNGAVDQARLRGRLNEVRAQLAGALGDNGREYLDSRITALESGAMVIEQTPMGATPSSAVYRYMLAAGTNATGSAEDAKDIITEFAEHVVKYVIPKYDPEKLANAHEGGALAEIAKGVVADTKDAEPSDDEDAEDEDSTKEEDAATDAIDEATDALSKLGSQPDDTDEFAVAEADTDNESGQGSTEESAAEMPKSSEDSDTIEDSTDEEIDNSIAEEVVADLGAGPALAGDPQSHFAIWFWICFFVHMRRWIAKQKRISFLPSSGAAEPTVSLVDVFKWLNEHLTPYEKLLLRLTYVERRTSEEIGLIVGKSAEAVRQDQKRLRTKIKKLLNANSDFRDSWLAYEDSKPALSSYSKSQILRMFLTKIKGLVKRYAKGMESMKELLWRLYELAKEMKDAHWAHDEPNSPHTVAPLTTSGAKTVGEPRGPAIIRKDFITIAERLADMAPERIPAIQKLTALFNYLAPFEPLRPDGDNEADDDRDDDGPEPENPITPA